MASAEVRLSPAWLAMLGYAPDDHDGTADGWFALVHPEDRPRLEARLRAARDGGQSHGECVVRLRRHDGTYQWHRERLGVIERAADGTPRRLAGIGADVHEADVVPPPTPSDDAVAAIRRSQERFRLLARATRDVLWDWDVVRGVCWWSPNAAAIFGPDTSPGDGIAARTSRLHPDDQARIAALLEQAMTGALAVWEAEYRVRLADGTYGDFLDRVHLVRDARGVVVRMVGAMTDVTETKRAHRSLIEAHERLRATSRDVHLTETRERAALARELHDEFGQLLTAAKLSASWLKAFPTEDLPVLRQQAFIDKVTSLCDVLDMALHGVRNVATQLRPPALDQLGLARALEGLAAQIERYAGLQCLVDIDQATRARAFGPVEGAAIYRIVQELLTNTARHAQATTVQVRLSTIDGVVHLEVTDDGRGIPPETARSSGSLGLKGVRERAELLGGQVTVEGAPGAGTAVRVTVPVGDGA